MVNLQVPLAATKLTRDIISLQDGKERVLVLVEGYLAHLIVRLSVHGRISSAYAVLSHVNRIDNGVSCPTAQEPRAVQPECAPKGLQRGIRLETTKAI